MSTTSDTLPESCDYLVVGAGATGMAFCDSLIQGLLLQQRSNAPNQKRIELVLIDEHAVAGGQWVDSYDFLQLHQPSTMYGVESTLLQPSSSAATHRATRQEMLSYYATLIATWDTSTAGAFRFRFVGNARYDFSKGSLASSLDNNQMATICVNEKVVDARYLQPDLPISTPPTFAFDQNKIRCVPVNQIAVSTTDLNKYYVVIGAGKTGMDAIVYLLRHRKAPPSHVVWVAPHDPWITAREQIGNCMEFLHDATQLYRSSRNSSEASLDSVEWVQKTFVEWERQGKIYRLFDDDKALPTKFNDATLSKDELELLRTVPADQVIRGRGRVVSIDSTTGALTMQDGFTVALPWEEQIDKTTYVHCSAGAFNYSRQLGVEARPVFADKVLTLQDVYGTPGFCFVGSILGKLESMSSLTDAEKNALCNIPSPAPLMPNKKDGSGPSGGTVGGLSADHGFVQRLSNLRRWLATPELRDWLVGHRLFNLGHYASATELDQLVDKTWNVLKEAGMVKE